MKRLISLLLSLQMIASPALAASRIPGPKLLATTPPGVTELPKLQTGGVVFGATVDETNRTTQNRLDIYQNQDKAIIEWSTFNIGTNATVNFVQKSNGAAQKDWAILNRIYQESPSQIFGKLTADGKVYLINQNGILFGAGSQVNVGSLIASSLNMSNKDFLGGALSFKAENYQNKADYTLPGGIRNNGTITASSLGSVFLMGPDVDNYGDISVSTGQIGLVAGEQVGLTSSTDSNDTRTAKYVAVTTGSNVNGNVASNHEGGQLLADTGLIGMYGRTVNQDGVIRAVTALKKNGVIELNASDSIRLGATSKTETPVSESTETADQSFTYTPGQIYLQGLGFASSTSTTYGPTGQITSQGMISAPSGQVTLNASEHILLDSGSTIDVSGLLLDKAASANQVTGALNTVNLSDDYGQKKGILLGATITFDAQLGSAIGDVSGYLTTQEKSAQERSLTGGTINLNSGGDVTARPGSRILFAGGRTKYEEGSFATTVLYSNGQMYDIANAPEWLTYDRIGEKVEFHQAFVEGASAGTLNVSTKQVALGGSLDGSVQKGSYQTLGAEPVNDAGRQKARGWVEPEGGALNLGPVSVNSGSTIDSSVTNQMLGDVRIVASGSSGELSPDGTSVLSVAMLNNAGLGTLTVKSTGLVTVDGGARLTLLPGGAFTVIAQRIEFDGALTAHSGTVTLTTLDFPTAESHWIVLGNGSSIDASGSRIIDTQAGQGSDTNATHIAGGVISIQDRSYNGSGVFVLNRATLDVSGGYHVDKNNKVAGGLGGALSLEGRSVVLAGTARGYSLLGTAGGTLTIQTDTISLTTDGRRTLETFDPGNVAIGFSSDGSQFDQSGFSNLVLKSENAFTIGSGVVLAPSRTKTSVSSINNQWNATLVANVSDQQLSASSLNLAAGVMRDTNSGISATVSSNLSVAAGAVLQTTPGGSISLSASKDLDFAGTASATAGTITMTASTAGGNLTIGDGAKLLATGYNRQALKAVADGYGPGYDVMDGGTISLTAGGGLSIGTALLDVSGSMAVTSSAKSSTGRIVTTTMASNAGTINLSYAGDASLSRLGGTFRAFTGLPNLRGGTFSLSNNSINGLLLDAALLTALQNQSAPAGASGGFDAYRFASQGAVTFSGPVSLLAGRNITLDTPEIVAGGDVSLSAPWIRLTNSSNYIHTLSGTSAGMAALNLGGNWLDLEGNILLSGFKTVNAVMKNDIRVADKAYLINNSNSWSGMLSTAADLTLTAGRVYPMMQDTSYGTAASDYTISTTGNLSIKSYDPRSPDYSPVYSALGSLTLLAGKNIDISGVVMAPLGSITIKATGPDSTVYLAPGSLVSTAGAYSVNYGAADGLSWTVYDKATGNAKDFDPSGTITSDVTLAANQVVVADKATIDVSGGGGVSAYKFQPAIEGHNNPLAGSFVILPDNSVQVPGNAVYLSGIPGLKDGVYYVLPQYFAYVTGALVVTPLKTKVDAGYSSTTTQGYAVGAGYSTYAGSSVVSPVMTAYRVRKAGDVLKEGNFSPQTANLDNSGALTLAGSATIINGTITAGGATGEKYDRTISLSGTETIVGNQQTALPDGFGDGNYLLDSSLTGKLVVADSSISGKGFSTIILGDAAATDSVTISAGSTLEAGAIKLLAAKTISVGDNVQLIATTPLAAADANGQGTVTISTDKGTADLSASTSVHATYGISVDVKDGNIGSAFKVDSGTISLSGNTVSLAHQSTAKDSGAGGIFLTDDMLNSAQFDAKGIILQGRSGMKLLEDVTVNRSSDLTLDSPLITSVNGGTAAFGAQTLTVKNSGSTTSAPAAGSGILNLKAQNMVMDGGAIGLGGFKTVNLASDNDITMRGAGSFSTAGALTLQAKKLTTSYARDASSNYVVADYAVNAGGKVTILGNGTAEAASSASSGGALKITGASIEDSGIIDAIAGRITLAATGSGPDDSVHLLAGARINAKGSDYAPAGSVTLQAAAGSVQMDTGTVASSIDVSAGAQGDAGSLAIAASKGTVGIAGDVTGQAKGGLGGSVTIDTGTLADFSGLNVRLNAGGFSTSRDVRVRSGDIVVAGGDTVTASTVRLTADTGGILVQAKGTIDASGTNGGTVELYAANSVAVSGTIKAAASGTGGAGGAVLLSSSGGGVSLDQSGSFNVSGNGSGQGGSVTFRLLQDKFTDLSVKGAISGEESVNVRAVKVYDYGAGKILGASDYGTVGDSQNGTWYGDAQAFIGSQNTQTIKNGLGYADKLHLTAEIEARGAGDLTVGSDLDTTTWRFAGEAGVLTLRAAGNLNIQANLDDHPTTVGNLDSKDVTRRSTWGFNLAAGSDFSGAGPQATVAGIGDLTIGKRDSSGNLTGGVQVYSEKALVALSAGRDVTIGPNAGTSYMSSASTSPHYSVGTYDGSVKVSAGRNINIISGAIQSATGNIDLNSGGDLKLSQGSGTQNQNYIGTVRTLGENIVNPYNYWEYANGGSISIRTGGSLVSQFSNIAWDAAYETESGTAWGASYEDKGNGTSKAAQGVVTLGGGGITVRSGRGVTGQIGAFGQGDLAVYSGGDISGRFLAANGTGVLNAMGAVGKKSGTTSSDLTELEAAATHFNVSAQGDVTINSIINPSLVELGLASQSGDYWNLSYSRDASVKLASLTGDVAITGDSFYNYLPSSSNYKSARAHILPGTVDISAGRDVSFSSDYYLAPSTTGNLTIAAGGTINGSYANGNQPTRSMISMSDADPDQVYGVQTPTTALGTLTTKVGTTVTASTPLHEDDSNPIRISAGGDIADIMFYLPKQAQVSAGGNITDMFLFGQNVSAGDTTTVTAGGNITFPMKDTTHQSMSTNGITIAGPGGLIVWAKGNIDLGASGGIQSVGNSYNNALGNDGSSLTVVAGQRDDSTDAAKAKANDPIGADEAENFFDSLRSAGNEYSELMAEGKKDEADAVIAKTRTDVIQKLLKQMSSAESGATGNINMVQSQIATLSGADNINVLAANTLNVGKTVFGTSGSTGIYTAAGGNINLYAGQDINVNESRVMTFMGGDITAWADRGNINAGRGSRTAVSASKAKMNSVTHQVTFAVPSVGSGIRALTYDPDGIDGPQVAPPLGDIYLFAPTGIIDAGEAGISGNNVVLGANAVLNARNISFLNSSVGFSSGESTVNLGAISGTSALADSNKMVEQTAALGGAKGGSLENAADKVDQLIAGWLDVKVISFDAEDDGRKQAE